jgi:hypothetical protein
MMQDSLVLKHLKSIPARLARRMLMGFVLLLPVAALTNQEDSKPATIQPRAPASVEVKKTNLSREVLPRSKATLPKNP